MYIIKQIRAHVCARARTRKQLCAAACGGERERLHPLPSPPRTLHLSPPSFSRNDVKKRDFNFTIEIAFSRVGARARRGRSLRSVAPRAMKFEFTRAQLIPAKFIGRDGKCAFHDCRQVPPAPPFSFRVSVSESRARASRLKLADCYLNLPYRTTGFSGYGNIIVKKILSFFPAINQRVYDRERRSGFFSKKHCSLIVKNTNCREIIAAIVYIIRETVTRERRLIANRTRAF